MLWVFLIALLWLLGQAVFVVIDIARQGWEKPAPEVMFRAPNVEEGMTFVRLRLQDGSKTCHACQAPADLAQVTFYCEADDPTPKVSGGGAGEAA